MTRTEAIELHKQLADLHRTIRRNVALDVFADAADRMIEALDEEINYLSSTTDERFAQMTAT
jgi:hypothetical protein